MAMQWRIPEVAAKDQPLELLASLLIAARKDAAVRQQILHLARLPRAQRESIVNTALHEMELRGEAASARGAFATLATDEGSRAAIAFLQDQ